MNIRRAVTTVGAAAALALLPGSQAEAQNFHFQCPGCTTVGNAFSDDLYAFTIDPTGTYDLWARGTQGAAFDIFILLDPSNPGDRFFTSPFQDPLDNSNTLVGNNLNLAFGTTYYIGAETTNDCGPGKTTCQLQLSLLQDGEDPVFEPVPEPATMLLLGTGLLGVIGVARRRRETEV